MKLITPLLSLLILFSCTDGRDDTPRDERTYEASYQTAPFDSLDVIATNDWWKRGPNKITKVDVGRDSILAFGAYTVANGVLKMTAQLYPLYPDEARSVKLEFKQEGNWTEAATAEVNEIGWHAFFRMEDWDDTRDVPYRLSHPNGATFGGTIRHVPAIGEPVSIAAFSCNSSHDTGTRDAYARNVEHLDPDLVFFAGDQTYFHKEHTAGWLLFGTQFRETFRHRPMISIPDDHDIGQGNLWGESGKVAERIQGDDGGYYYDADYVKMVERAQTHHLPDAYNPTPVEQGINVYYTSYPFGSLDLAVLEDRKFKSGPKGKIPQQGPRPDHILNPDYDPSSVDVEGLKLLGDRQLEFLEDWSEASANNERPFQVVLSQTGFCNGAHIHGTPDNRLHADMDSNGWPQTGRNKALRLIRDAGAVHIAGDQHISTVIQHGIDDHRDGPYHFLVPAVVNDYYSRWWWPVDERAGDNPLNDQLPWLGDYRDGFDNRITMMAYANPDQRDNGAGFGFIEFDVAADEVTFNCYPRTVDLAAGEDEQFVGWPIVVKP